MPVGVVPAPFVITDNDKRGLIVVSVAVSLAFVWVCFFVRIWLRSQTREWRSDDWFLAAATFLDTAQSGVIIRMVGMGLGGPKQHVSLLQLEKLGKHGYSSSMFYILTLLASKLSVLLLYLRLSPGGAHRIMSWSMLASSCVWAILSIVLIAIPCNPVQFYVSAPGECKNMWAKWQAISALDIVIEAVIFFIAVQLVWSLNMRRKSKILVVLAFSARLPVIGIIGIRLSYLRETVFDTNITYASTFYLVATQWQMSYAIISSTLTGLGPFLRPFNEEYMTSYRRAHYAQTAGFQDTSGTFHRNIPMSRIRRDSMPDGTAKRSHTDSALSSADRGRHSPTSQTSIVRAAGVPTFRPVGEGVRHDAEVWAGERGSVSRDDEAFTYLNDETRLVITKKTEMRVESDRVSRTEVL